jgi:hypothetical protein
MLRLAFFLVMLCCILFGCNSSASHPKGKSDSSAEQTTVENDTTPTGFRRDWLAMSPEKRQTYYTNLCSRIEAHRLKLAARWKNATSENTQQRILRESRNYIFTVLTDTILVCWYNTPWDFNGVSQQPGQGTIACGYFVTTTLQDAGFRLERIWLSQQASSILIKKFADKAHIKTVTNKQTDKILRFLDQQEQSLFIIGLDIHTGFVVRQNEKTDMLHASFWPQRKVVREPMKTSAIINESKFFMTGDILKTDITIIKWLEGKSFGQ